MLKASVYLKLKASKHVFGLISFLCLYPFLGNWFLGKKIGVVLKLMRDSFDFIDLAQKLSSILKNR